MNYKKISKKHVEARLYGNIGTWWTNGESFSSFLDDMEAQGYEELTLRMHCYGGSVIEGNVMANALERTNIKVNVVIDGLAASMGCFILPYIPKENVMIAANAFGMVHRPRWGGGGDADDLLQQAKLLQDMENDFVKTVAERTGKLEADVRALWFDGKDHWLNADEMIQYGFAGAKTKKVAASIKDLDKNVIESMGQESVYDRFAALLDSSNNNKKQKKMNVSLWIAAFQLEGLTAESTEEAVLAALQAKQNKLNERINNLEASAKLKAETEINAVLDDAERGGKFNNMPGKTKEQARAFYKELAEKSGIDALRTVVASIQGSGTKPTIMQSVTHGATAHTASAQVGLQTWDDYQAKNPVALQAMSNENHPDHEVFRELYKAEFGVYPQ